VIAVSTGSVIWVISFTVLIRIKWLLDIWALRLIHYNFNINFM
jgi:hypothetical protein